MRVAIRVDAGPLIGGGHAMRCLTLANALAREGAEIIFAAATMPYDLKARITEAGHKFVELAIPRQAERVGPDWHEAPLGDEAQRKDVDATEAACGRIDWLVVDHYLLDARWHSAARRFADKLLVIDDLANRPCDCDILLDQTHGRSAADYRRFLPPDARILAGAGCALLRPEFTRERPAALERRRELDVVRRILVSLGTTDPGGITATIVEQVLAAAPGRAIDVVLGPDASSVSRVRGMAREDSRVSIHVGTNNMAELMRDADIAVGAAGATSWERSCLGLPAIVVVLAENQRMGAFALAKAGALITVESVERIAASLIELMEDIDRLKAMAAAAFAITDGKGAERVTEIVLEKVTRTRSRAARFT